MPRLRTAPSVLAWITAQFGYLPAESLVLLPLQRRVNSAVLRLDLPAADRPDHPEEYLGFVGWAIGMALHVPQTDAVIAAVFTSTRLRLLPAPPWSALIGALRLRADEAGLHVQALFYRGADGWGEYGGPVPSEGLRPRSLAELGEASARLSPSEPSSGGRQLLLQRSAAPSTPRRVHGDTPDEVWEQALRDEAGSEPQLSRTQCEQLTAAFASPLRAETLLAQAAFGRHRYPDLAIVWRQLDATASPGIGTTRANELRPGTVAELQSAFDPDRCERALLVIQQLVEQSPPARAAPLHAAQAWLAWALGHGSAASGWARLALLTQPLEFARLVGGLADDSVLPVWFGKPPGRHHVGAA